MKGELNPGEPHPATRYAYDYVINLGPEKLAIWRESFVSCVIKGNRVGEICGETLERILTGQPVSDRYVMGLALTLMYMESEA